MNKNRGIYYFLISLLIVASAFSVGISTWVIGGKGEKSVSVSNTKENNSPICYSYETSSGSNGAKTYYSTLEGALENTNGDSTAHTIVMIPGDSSTVYTYSAQNGVLGVNDALILPYSGELYGSGDSELINSNVTTFGDQSETTNLKLRLKMLNKSKLTISTGASLYIGGKRNSSANSFSGGTIGSYAELYMIGSANITCNGAMYCYGFVKEGTSEENASNSPTINVLSGTLYESMAIYNWPGGTASGFLASTNKVCFPFSRYDLPNIRPSITMDSNSKLYGMYTVTASGSVVVNESTQIVGSSDCLFNLNSGTNINIKFDDETNNKTSSSDTSHKLNVIVDGDMTFDKVKVSVSSFTIVSSDYYFPISPCLQIIINSGTSTIKNRLKFMPKSSLTIESGASVKISAKTVFYQSYKNSSNEEIHYWNSKFNGASAKLINNGNLTINAAFGGHIDTESYGAMIQTGSSFDVDDSCKEFYTNSLNYPISTDAFSFTPTFYEFNDLSIKNSVTTLYANKTYYSSKSLNSNYGYGTKTATLSISGNSFSMNIKSDSQMFTLSTSNLIGDEVRWTSTYTCERTGDKGDHVYGEDGICTICGKDNNLNYLTFKISGKGNNAYAYVSSCKDTATKIIIPATYNGYKVKEIATYAFRYCKSLKSITIPESVEKISEYAFEETPALEKFIVNENSSYFSSDSQGVLYDGGKTSLVHCPAKLSEITIPDSVTSIEDYAFDRCTLLENIDLPDGVNNIGDQAFGHCSSLKSMVIPDGVTYLASMTFYKCTSLKTIKLSSNLDTLGLEVFNHCTVLEEIYIPKSVTFINFRDGNCFAVCSAKFVVDEENTEYSSDDQGIIYNKDKTILYAAPISLTSAIVPDSVTEINYSAFNSSAKLNYIVIGSSLTLIDQYAFYDCVSLKNVYYKGNSSSRNSLKSKILSYNTCLTNAKLYYYSETTPSTSGNYWHYVDGIPTSW